ncbi:ADP-ribosylglycohydrolase family protein [Leuconostoc pseudomesenteroides]|uniref:ADP-ribosylglycohydrolase family protein n=1 Tax=Leuconostoc pseudomesenteroides TaxID=33968 RepID=UPI0039E9BB00
MSKKQSTIQFLIFGMAIGESIASLPANDQDKVLNQQFDRHLEWGTQVSLSLATTASLTRGYQLADVMAHLQNWYQRRQYAPVGTHQSIDDVTKKALDNYIKNRDMLSAGVSDDAADSDNILARMLPVALYLHHQYGTSFVNDETAMMLLHRIAGLTHNDEGALVTVGMMSLILSQILDGNNLSDAVENGLAFGFEYYSRHQVFVSELSAFDELNLPDFRNIPADKIVLDGKAASTLEAVIWSLLNSQNYTEAIKNSLVHGHANSVVPTLVAAIAAVYYRDDMVLRLSQNFVARRLLATIVSQAERSARFS